MSTICHIPPSNVIVRTVPEDLRILWIFLWKFLWISFLGRTEALGLAGRTPEGRASTLPSRLAEQVGGLLVADFGDSRAMALGGGRLPLAGIDGSQQVGEFLQAAETEVEGHIEKRGLGGRGVSAPVGQRGGERCFEVVDIARDQRIDIGIGHAALGERG